MSTLSQERKFFLVSGYTRLNFYRSIPHDVLLLLIKWINDTLYINISGDDLQKLLSNQLSKQYLTYIIPLADGISMECVLHPNMKDDIDMDATDDPWISLQFIAKAPLNIKWINFYVEDGCEQIMNSLSKSSSRYTMEQGESRYTHRMTPVSQCKNKDILTFYVYVELISIHEIYDLNIQKYLIKSPIFNEKIEYTWIIDTETLNTTYKYCELMDFVFSSNFGSNCIAFFLTPTGFHDKDSPRFGVEFYKLPNKVDYLSVEVELKTNIKESNGDGIQYTTTQKVERGHAVFLGPKELTTDKILNSSQELMFHVTITIIDAYVGDMYREDGKAIDKSAWKDFGLCVENV